ncbi:MAG TPA: M28 family peptidase [Burkholderiales bacterium]|nr:M28 family peptidase [Burkholderiales bacterium]
MEEKCESRLVDHVGKLAGEIGERNYRRPGSLDLAAGYIESQWREMGYEVLRQRYKAKGVECCNLEVVLPGALAESIVIGTHYDTVSGSPGADDNASGVSVLLEIARMLRNVPMKRTVKLAAFSNEEAPFYFWGEMGSGYYAREAKRRGDDIRLMISLEMLGYFSDEPGSQSYPPLFRYFHPDRGNFIAFVSNFGSRGRMQKAASCFRKNSDFPLETSATFSWIPGVAWSDHISFWRTGYKAFMCTDTSFFRNPHYHLAGDTPEKLDYARLAALTGALSKMCADIACCEKL